MNLVFMVEELSMKAFLEGFLPRVLPHDIQYLIIPHEGKSDLEKSIPRKLRAWRAPDARFVIVRDQDNSDCRKIKDQLRTLCRRAGRSDALIRIACRELESWFLGDLEGVAEAFNLPKLASMKEKSKFRAPDSLGNPSQELAKLVPGYGKVRGARAMGPLLDVARCRSTSLKSFEAGLRRLIENGPR
ncbi:MAG: DUF4276 family protein [Myxococcota bacterium]